MPEIENNNLNNAKNVEKLLKEYSNSRRAAIGDDFELSSSRRNALLSEALKTHSRQDVSGYLYSLLTLRWVQLGAFAALVLITGFLVYMNTLDKKELTLAKKVVKPEQADLPNVADRESVEPKTTLTFKEKKTLTEKYPDQPVLMRTTTPQVAAEKEAEVVRESLSVRSEIATAKTTPTSPPAEPPMPIGEKAVKGESSTYPLQSRQLEISGNSENLNKALENFRVELRGSNIVMVEPDGSKYEGIALNDLNVITNSIRSEIHFTNFIANIQASSLPDSSAKQAQFAVNQGMPQVIFFNVNGSNRSLKNYLEFSGRLVQNAITSTENNMQLSSENAQQNLQIRDRRNVAIGRASEGFSATGMRSAPANMASPQVQSQTRMPHQEIQPQIQSQIPGNQAIIEGILTIGNYTNIPIRAIMNSDGYFMRVINR